MSCIIFLAVEGEGGDLVKLTGSLLVAISLSFVVDPDPNSLKMLDPDSMNPDPQY
jgi:hypothetical protein